MSKVVVLPEHCKSCGLCIHICPKNVISIGDKPNARGYYYVIVSDGDKCIGCGLCAMMCPDIAIELYKD